MSIFNKCSLIISAIIFVLLATNAHSQNLEHCKVSRIVDGDTIYCITNENEEEKVRLIGVDAPESIITQKAYKDSDRTGDSIETIKKMGMKSKEFVESRLQIGTGIKLEFDIQKKGKYGRTMAYVFLPDGTMLNELLVKEGYAQVSTYTPNVKYEKLFIEAQKSARENKRGLWE